jgi:hypothetical protein
MNGKCNGTDLKETRCRVENGRKWFGIISVKLFCISCDEHFRPISTQLLIITFLYTTTLYKMVMLMSKCRESGLIPGRAMGVSLLSQPATASKWLTMQYTDGHNTFICKSATRCRNLVLRHRGDFNYCISPKISRVLFKYCFLDKRARLIFGSLRINTKKNL